MCSVFAVAAMVTITTAMATPVAEVSRLLGHRSTAQTSVPVVFCPSRGTPPSEERRKSFERDTIVAIAAHWSVDPVPNRERAFLASACWLPDVSVTVAFQEAISPLNITAFLSNSILRRVTSHLKIHVHLYQHQKEKNNVHNSM